MRNQEENLIKDPDFILDEIGKNLLEGAKEDEHAFILVHLDEFQILHQQAILKGKTDFFLNAIQHFTYSNWSFFF